MSSELDFILFISQIFMKKCLITKDVDSFMEITDIMERNREETPILSSKHHQTPSLYVVRNCRKSNHLWVTLLLQFLRTTATSFCYYVWNEKNRKKNLFFLVSLSTFLQIYILIEKESHSYFEDHIFNSSKQYVTKPIN